MLLNNRVILDDNGSLIDLSSSLNNYVASSSTIEIVAAQDKLYLGSDLPFNHRYFQIDVANANASLIDKIEYWVNPNWQEVVDIIDETEVSGKTISQSGIISFTTNKLYDWNSDDTHDGSIARIPELAAVKIYGLYWLRISFTANFSALTALKYIGHKFANDTDLAITYPDLVRSDTLDHFKTGKTNWDEQMIYASEFIIRDLKKRGVIVSANQLMDWSFFQDACVHKCAEIIYNGFGKDFLENKADAQKEYQKALNTLLPAKDLNNDGRLDPGESFISTGILKR